MAGRSTSRIPVQYRRSGSSRSENQLDPRQEKSLASRRSSNQESRNLAARRQSKNRNGKHEERDSHPFYENSFVRNVSYTRTSG